MTNEALLLTAILVPTLGSFLLPLAVKAGKTFRNVLGLIFVAASFVCSLALLPAVLGGETPAFSLRGPLGLDFAFRADALAVFMALVSSFIGAVIVLYSFDYISHYENQNEYYLMAVLFVGSMMGLVYSTNLVFLFVFWEITSIASWRLIGFYRNKYDVLRADKAFLVTSLGALLMLVGIIAVYGAFGTFDLDALKGYVLPTGIGVLFLAGMLSKSATLPFHTWLPDAGVAPSPVTALLHAAVLVKIGVYFYARVFLATFLVTADFQTAVIIIAAASALVSAGAALVETNLKRIIAYSTVSQIAFIFLGLASGNTIGAVGGLLYILAHGLAKGGLFLCAGIIEQNTGTKDIRELGGLLKTMPVTAAAFLLCAFSVMGLPPLSGFFSKYLVLSAAVSSGRLWLAAVFAAGAVLTILYLLRLFSRIFLGESRGKPPVAERSPLMVGVVVGLAALGLVCGLLIAFPAELAGSALGQMVGLAR